MSDQRHERMPPKMLLEHLEPFVVAPGWRFDRLDMEPLGVSVDPAHRFDILRAASGRFLDRLVHLDRLTFGAVGMSMPEWLFNDVSALPGVIAGLGVRARILPAELLTRLGFDAREDELIPLSMFIAVPARPPAAWFGHNLASLNRLLPELHLRGLAGVTKALGLRVMCCTEQLGATQWESKALHVHTRFGPLELLTAWTPAHSELATLTYRLRITDAGIADVLHSRRRCAPNADTFWIDTQGHEAMRALQQRIEHGERFAIVGPPARDTDGGTRIPVVRLAPDLSQPSV
ncbi:hypothetical protein MNBD_PLANCTO03-2233 [hydrothermal vent metagenome]|uniref:Uncharacterized protein n=1 Tax=hydrothermal vent metagenome TaxID=652676 RepID=A0A3B1DM32_9ZZZZ